MRILITVLILIFSLQSWASADDIRDFEIDGISIGDSLLDHFSKGDIIRNTSNFNSDDKFTMTCLQVPSKTYDRICISFKFNDKNYIIHGLVGQKIFTNNDINICYKKQQEIDDQASIDFKNLKRKDWGVLQMDPKILEIDPNATYRPITYDFKSDKERLQIACYDFDMEDRLKVALYSEEYGKHITYDAKKAN